MNVNGSAAPPGEFASRMNGYLSGMLRWEQLDALWQRVLAQPQGWYVSEAGAVLPRQPLEADDLRQFVTELDARLRREHEHDFCGLAYTDDPGQPALVKVYDPQHMGSFCSTGNAPTPPRWVLSRSRPERIDDEAPAPAARRHWWSRFFAGSTG